MVVLSSLSPGPGQTWTDYVRQLLSFVFGVVIIVYGVFISSNSIVPELVIGLLLMGIIPLDLVLGRLGLGNGKPSNNSGGGHDGTTTPG